LPLACEESFTASGALLYTTPQRTARKGQVVGEECGRDASTSFPDRNDDGTARLGCRIVRERASCAAGASPSARASASPTARRSILPFALSGQRGTHHVNCQPNIHWIRRFWDQFGFWYDPHATQAWKAAAKRRTGGCPWVVRNAMALVRPYGPWRHGIRRAPG
jgi:hypothetical protein